MVGYIMLMKLIHSKFNRRRRSNQQSTKVKEEFNDSLQFREENFQEPQTCRICLKDGDISIFGDSDTTDVSEDIRTFADIDISQNDPYPKFLCQSCHSLLQGALLFRKTAQISDENLRRPASIHSNNDDNTAMDNYYESELTDVKESSDYHCKRCDLSYNTFEEYSEHRLSEEHENMRQVCPICNNSYTAIYFKKHLALHKLETSYMCDVCGKKFVVKGQFTRHRLTHFYDLPFKCSLCPYRGRFRESLKMHMRSHTGERPYQCSQCPSRFGSKSNLNKHMLIHKGDHDFKCESCGRGFYTKRDLELHFKVDHTGIKDHVCNICGKAFGYRKQMMKHQLKVHKRQKLKTGRIPLYLQVESKIQQEND
ncbi:zinc finger protein 227-like [Colias croceus]|uniref:zinc finger protein 227-like n=1 Tax=Colias crocea TaxID=72248 RepID=UPI001E27CCF3|nr:zinc finger protein 227-like [Colias croceus]